MAFSLPESYLIGLSFLLLIIAILVGRQLLKTRKQVIEKIQDKLKDPLVLECKNEKDYNSETGQTKLLKMIIGTPLIARKSNKKYKIAKNEMYYVIDINTTITLKELETENEVQLNYEDILKYFVSGYCITIHKSQGETYDDEYTIYDWGMLSKDKKLNRRLRYVAQSRSTNPKKNIYYII